MKNKPVLFHVAAVFLIAVITAAVYANSIDNEFTNWDDDALVVNNRSIRSLDFENIKKIFAYHPGGTYQPVRNFSYAIDFAIGKLDTKWYHIHNIFLHLFAAVFLYFTLIHALPQIQGWQGFVREGKSEKTTAGIIAFIAVLLFAVHPVNVESVTWLSARKYVDLSFFSFLSFLLFVLSSSEEVVNPFKKVKTFLLSAGSVCAAVLAVFSSPFGVFLPGLFFLFDYCREENLNPFLVFKKRFSHYIPYICFVAVIFPMLWFALAGSFGGAAMSHYKGQFIYTQYTIFNVLFDYARNMIMPLWLNNRYVDYIFLSPFDIYKIPVSFLSLLLISGVTAWQVKQKSKMLLFCVGWFFIAWLPASNIVPISTKMADRYIYIASVGFFLWAGLYFYKIINKKISYMIIGGILSAAVIGCLSVLTVQRNTVWKNSGTLWQDSLEKDPGNYMAHNNLGNYLFMTGKADKAEYHYKQALKNAPYAVKSLDNLGLVYGIKGEYKKAELSYKKLLKFRPGDQEVYQKIGDLMIKTRQFDKAAYYFKQVVEQSPENFKALNSLGNIKFKTGDFKAALAYYREANKLDTENPDILFNKGLVLSSLGSGIQAHNLYEKTLKLAPGHLNALNSLGLYMQKTGKPDKASEYYKKAIQINPEFMEAHNNFGNVLFTQNEINKARSSYEKAISLNPGYADAHYNLAVLLGETNKSKALEQYKAVLKIEPGHVQALNNMGNLYLSLGEIEKGIHALTKAVELKPDFFEARFNLAYALSVDGSLEQAAIHYETAGQMHPDDIQVFYNLAVIKAALGRFDMAVKYFKHVLEIEPYNLQVKVDLGVALFRKKDYEQAKKYLKQVLLHDPENKIAKKVAALIQNMKTEKQ